MNKVEKIKAEIEGRIKSYEKYCSGNPEYFKENYPEKYYAIAAYTDLYSFLDSLSDTEKDFGIKESVIPFGASDSELMEATYFIPQGHHAVIDGNKVIIKKGEDPVSNDLEEAAIEALHTEYEKGRADVIAKTEEWIQEFGDNNYIMQYSDSCEHPINEILEQYKNFINKK